MQLPKALVFTLFAVGLTAAAPAAFEPSATLQRRELVTKVLQERAPDTSGAPGAILAHKIHYKVDKRDIEFS
ncbi:hypothetical protein PsYK624_000820 [Phanerochaete sordida]|uniref:Uncharacterized protein n=1 Tax=Phanerochaete sordida TaxID=48140 RepID=A0A9P3FWS6_9APHY|nr:hypothetical protein PsYK624_000820 [Phanerochaete sordida]